MVVETNVDINKEMCLLAINFWLGGEWLLLLIVAEVHLFPWDCTE